MSDKVKQKDTGTGGSVFVGEVVSDKMDKTVVVEVTRMFRHPVYGKIVKKKKLFKVHDSENSAGIGDTVEFRECRPISKSKHAVLVRILLKS